MTNAIARINQQAAPAATRVSQSTAVEQARAIAEVQAAVYVAQQFPRDTTRAWAEMRASCGRLALASRAFYTVTNRGTGPSVHLARELARIWGNLDHGVRELRRDDEGGESEVQAFAWDQQTNVRSMRSFIHPHARMVGGQRRALTDLTDIYLSNQNVGARAVRECLFTVMPADFVAEAQDLCRATIEKGDGKPLVERITDMITVFGGLGVKVGQIESRLGRKRGQWTAVDVADLGVVYSSIKRAETTAADEFPHERVSAEEVLQQAAAKAEAVADDEPARATREQLAENLELLTAAGYTDRAEAKAFVEKVLGRPVAARTDLTPAEIGLINARLVAIDEPPDDDEGFDALGPNLLSDKQRNHIMALAGELGLTDREARLDYMSGILDRVDRPVTTTNELLRHEAVQVIDAMIAAKAAQDAAAEAKPLREVQQEQSATLRRTRKPAGDGAP